MDDGGDCVESVGDPAKVNDMLGVEQGVVDMEQGVVGIGQGVLGN